jgi:hypothetical protein
MKKGSKIVETHILKKDILNFQDFYYSAFKVANQDIKNQEYPNELIKEAMMIVTEAKEKIILHCFKSMNEFLKISDEELKK